MSMMSVFASLAWANPTSFVLKVLWIFLASWSYFQQPSSYSSRYNNLKLHRWRSRVTNQILLLLRCSIPNLTWIARELANHLPDCAWDQSCWINSFRRARTFHTYLIRQRKNKGQRRKDKEQKTEDKIQKIKTSDTKAAGCIPSAVTQTQRYLKNHNRNKSSR